MNDEAHMTAFILESNRIEGILREPTSNELAAHAGFFALLRVGVPDLQSFVHTVAHAELRRRPGMDVRVGSHRPPPGGPQLVRDLVDLLEAKDGHLSPHAIHVRYELLHPFMDGNGRSGRVLWAWQMRREGGDPFALPFLHRFYYDALDAASS